MTNWNEFAVAEPELAGRAYDILSCATNCVLGTLRADGSPRLSGIDPWFHDGELWFGSMPGARKSADLHRDPRLALHGIPWESRRVKDAASDPGDGDAKVTGRAISVTDPDARLRAMAPFLEDGEAFDPADVGDLFCVDIESVVTISVADDLLVIDRWTRTGGRTVVRRT